MSRSRTGWLVDGLLLTLACALMYLPALDAVGLSTWQESQRAMVSREMHAAGQWIVPLINGHPYLAKPPLYYWCNLLIARASDGAPDEHTLRLTSAAFATLGVLATYAMARALCSQGLTRRSLWTIAPEVHARGAGLLAALMLATGPAYARAARVGELDIALAPSITLAIGAAGLALVAWTQRGRLAAGWIALSAAAGCVAALTKGPPALALIGGAAAISVLLWAAGAPARRTPPARASGAPEGSRSEERVPVIVGALAAFATLPFTVADGLSLAHLVGVVVDALVIGWLAALAARALIGGRSAHLVRAAWGVQPWLTIGLPVLAFGAWAWTAASRVGMEAAARWSQGEAESNFVLLDAEVPFINLSAAAWSVGLASVLFIVALWWCVARRPRLTTSGIIIAGWLAAGLVIFSCFGKGFQRYLTPVWPAVAIVGGEAAMRLIAASVRRSARAALLGGVLGAMVVGTAVWFAVLHPRQNASRSPREMLAELAPAHARVRAQAPGDPRLEPPAPTLVVFQFWTAAIDYYALERPLIVGDPLENAQNIGREWMKESAFAQQVKRDGRTYLVLMRETDRPDRIAASPAKALSGAERLRRLGLDVLPMDTRAEFRFDGGRTRIVAALVRSPANPDIAPEPSPVTGQGASPEPASRAR